MVNSSVLLTRLLRIWYLCPLPFLQYLEGLERNIPTGKSLQPGNVPFSPAVLSPFVLDLSVSKVFSSQLKPVGHGNGLNVSKAGL